MIVSVRYPDIDTEQLITDCDAVVVKPGLTVLCFDGPGHDDVFVNQNATLVITP